MSEHKEKASYSLHVKNISGLNERTKTKSPDLYIKVRYGDESVRSRIKQWGLLPSCDLRWSTNLPEITVEIKESAGFLKRSSTIGRIANKSLEELLTACRSYQETTLSLSQVSSNDDLTSAATINLTVQLREDAAGNQSPSRSRSSTPVPSFNFMRSKSPDLDLPQSPSSPTHSNSTYPSISCGEFSVELSKVRTHVQLLVQVIDKSEPMYFNAALSGHIISQLVKLGGNLPALETHHADILGTLNDLYDIRDRSVSLKEHISNYRRQLTSLVRLTVQYVILLRWVGITRSKLDISEKLQEFEKTLHTLSHQLSGPPEGSVPPPMPRRNTTFRQIDEEYLINIRQRLSPSNMDILRRYPCFQGTRQKTLTTVAEWLITPSEGQNIIWLHGTPGSGKSAVATSIALWAKDIGRLGALVYFDGSDPNHSDPGAVIRSIVCQIAEAVPELRARFSAAAQEKDISRAPMRAQFKKLLRQPLSNFSDRNDIGPIIIVIDGLEQCGNAASRKSLLAVLAQKFFLKLPHIFRLLVTSEKQYDIYAAFGPQRNIFAMELTHDEVSNRNDMIAVLEEEFNKIRQRSIMPLPSEWPTHNTIEKLAKMSSGLFVWGSRAMAFIAQGPDPVEKLDSLLASESKYEIAHTSSLDILYETILSTLGRWTNKMFSDTFQKIIGAVFVLRTPLPEADITNLLELRERAAHLLLTQFKCFFYCEPDKPIYVLHRSIGDFLCRKSIDDDPPWYINKAWHQENLALRCLDVLSTLQFNVMRAPSSHEDLSDEWLSASLQEHVPLHVQYVCKFWADHLHECHASDELVVPLKGFLYNNFLSWLEVMSALRAIPRARDGLLKAAKWASLHTDTISTFLDDAVRFLETFQVPITRSIPHIYLSALPFCPTSEVALKYQERFSSVLRAVSGTIARWPSKRSDGHQDRVNGVTFTPDDKHIVSCSSDRSIRIWREPGHEIAVSRRVNAVACSTDGQYIVAGLDDGSVSVWELDTGVPVCEFSPKHAGEVKSVAFTSDTIASGSADGTISLWNWNDKQAALITSLTDHADEVNSVAFSLNGTHLISASSDGDIYVWDGATGSHLQGPLRRHMKGVNAVKPSFDGQTFASASDDQTIIIWNMHTGEPISKLLHGHTDAITCLDFSRDGEHMVSGSADQTIQVWDLPTATVEFEALRDHTEEVTSVSYSPDGTRIVSGSSDHTIEIWNAETGKVVTDEYLDFETEVAASEDPPRLGYRLFDDGSRLDVWEAGVEWEEDEADSFVSPEAGAGGVWIENRNKERLFWLPYSDSQGFWWSERQRCGRNDPIRLDLSSFVYGDSWIGVAL